HRARADLDLRAQELRAHLGPELRLAGAHQGLRGRRQVAARTIDEVILLLDPEREGWLCKRHAQPSHEATSHANADPDNSRISSVLKSMPASAPGVPIDIGIDYKDSRRMGGLPVQTSCGKVWRRAGSSVRRGC